VLSWVILRLPIKRIQILSRCRSTTFSNLHWIRHKNTGVLLRRRLPYLVFLHLPSPLLLPSTMVIVQLVYQPIYYKYNITTLVLTPTSCYRILVGLCTPTGLVVVVMSPVLRITLKSTYH
jgi:hypothetical protein